MGFILIDTLAYILQQCSLLGSSGSGAMGVVVRGVRKGKEGCS